MSTRGASVLRYKDYAGSIEASIEDGCLHGRLLHIDDVITYEGQTVAEVKDQFESAVDEYLLHCAAIGKAPERQYSGTFNVRVGTYRHKLIVQYGLKQGMNVNEVVCLAVDSLQKRDSGSGAGRVKPHQGIAPFLVGGARAGAAAVAAVVAEIHASVAQNDIRHCVLLTGTNTILNLDYPALGGSHGNYGPSLPTTQTSEPEHLHSVGAASNFGHVHYVQ